jgi:hypothetical protein
MLIEEEHTIIEEVMIIWGQIKDRIKAKMKTINLMAKSLEPTIIADIGE